MSTKQTKRLLSLLLAAVLLLTIAPPAFAADETAPTLNVELCRVVENNQPTDIVEVSILAGAMPYYSADVVLHYEADMVRPIKNYGNEKLATAAGATPWAAKTSGETKAHEAAAGKPALISEITNTNTGSSPVDGYLYLGVQALEDEMEVAANTALVTTRFQLTENGKNGIAGGAALTDFFEIAADDACVKGPSGYPATITTKSNKYICTTSARPANFEAMDARLGINSTGESRWGATGIFHTVVFYDWDETTVLGTRTVAHGQGISDAPKPNPEKLLYDANNNGTYDEGDVKDTREGYTFAGWVDYETGHCTPYVGLDAEAGQTQKAEDLVDLTSVTEDLVLKIAYDESGIIGSTPASRRYAPTNTDFVPASDDVTAGLETTICVPRRSTARRGYDGKLYLEIILRPTQGATYLNIPLGSSDYETYKLVLPSNFWETYQEDAIAYEVYTIDPEGKRESRSNQVVISKSDNVQYSVESRRS